MLEKFLVLIVALVGAIAFTPIVRGIAIRYGVMDRPDPMRKLHGRTVARAGGVAILLTVVVTCGLALLTYRNWTTLELMPFVGLFAVMLGVNLLGLADDIWTLRGRQKLAGQIILSTILVLSGYKIASIQLFGIPIEFGYLAIPISIVWLLATTNALNLIDGADGVCTTLGAIIFAAIGFLASYHGHFAESAIAFAFCGALLGFLFFNFPPASIFLGDSGSLLIGLVTGALAIRCSLKGPTVTFLVPLAILSIPLFDSAMAIIRRKLTGRSIYTTDRAHLHHSLKERGFSDRALVLVVAIMSIVTVGAAVLGSVLRQEWIAIAGTAFVLVVLVATKVFGHAEMMLVARRAKRFAASMVEPAKKTHEIVHENSVRLQGNREWEKIWQSFVEFAEQEGLCKLAFDLNVPWLHEGFHGSWNRSRQMDRLERWTTSLPIFGNGRIAGRLDVVGPASDDRTTSTLSKLLELIDDVSPQIERILVEQTPASSVTSTPTTGTDDSGEYQIIPMKRVAN